MTWNVEGIRRNLFTLKHFLDIVEPEMIFLNEIQTFKFEMNDIMEVFKGEY